MFKRILAILFLFISTFLQAQQMPKCWYKSQAALERMEYGTALQFIDSCILQKGKNYAFWLKKGEIQYDKGDYREALESLIKSDNLKQGSSSYLFAKTYCSIGDTALCFKHLKSYLGSSDKISEGLIKLEPAFEKVSSTKQWKVIWSKEWYNPYEKLVADAGYCLQNSNWEEAIDLLNPRLKGNKPRAQLLALRAEAYFGLGSFRGALDDYSTAIKRSNKNHQYFAGRAKTYISLEKYSSAIDDFSKAIEISGGKPQYSKGRAEAYYKNKQFEEAYDDIKDYLSYYPSDTDASFLFAIISIDYGSYVDALFSLGKLIKANPSEAKYYFYRGVVYIKTENFKVAEEDFNFAIAKEYNLADSYYQRGIARFKLGENNLACDDWEQASKLGNFKSQETKYKYCNKGGMVKW